MSDQAIAGGVGGATVPPERELRLCLVMYGGVSLAIYMNGVAREYFDLVRGRGVWGIFKRLADVDVVVDVISGASAGGLNGLFLAYALCGHREFGHMVDLWRNRAGIEALLGDPSTREPRSLLKSEYMEAELASAFATMPRVPAGRADELAVSDTPDLDCFMAATNFYGQRRTLGDPAGNPIPVKSHRATVHFKHRLGRKEPFGAPAPDGDAAPAADPTAAADRGTLSPAVLAKVARATSAFPAAFRPIELSGDDLHGRFATDDMDLAPGESAWYLDGGVLDNKPFTCALPMIYQRHADRPIDRMLFFVEPDPDADDQIGAAGERLPEPNFLETSLGALSSLPSYESILGEIRSIDGHNRKIELFDAVFGATEGLERRPPPPTQWEIYHRARLHRLVDDVSSELTHEQATSLLAEVGAPSGDAAARRDVPASVGFFRRVLEKFEGAETPRLTLKVRGIALDELDVDFVKRAFYYWTYRLHAQLSQQPGDPELRRKISFLADRIDMLLFLNARVDAAIDRLGVGITLPGIIDAMVAALTASPAAIGALEGARHATRMLSDRRRSGGADTADFITAYRQTEALPAAARASALLPALLPAFLALLDHEIGGDATAEFRCFDAWRFPAVYAADLGELDRIEYFRVSPIEAAAVAGTTPELARFRADPMRRLAGRHLAHFGAFLDKAWRSNDVMWGRVDGASVLWDVLLRRRGYRLAPERAAELLADLTARGWAASPDGELRELHALVADFAAGRSDPAALTAKLLACHQRWILVDGVPEVVADAVAQVRAAGDGSAGAPAEGAAPNQVVIAREMLAAFEGAIADPRLHAAARQAVRVLLGDDPREVLGHVASRYEVGAAGLSELDRQRVSVTALQAGRVVTKMLQTVLPDDGLAGSLRKAVAPVATALKSAHLLALSIREGIFPVVWLALLLAATATAAIGVLFLRGSSGWQVVVASSVVLGALLFAPRIWFGRKRALRIARWPLIGVLPLAVAAGVYWLQHRPAPKAATAAQLDSWARSVQIVGNVELVGAIVLLFATAGVALYARRERAAARQLRDNAAAQGHAAAASAALLVAGADGSGSITPSALDAEDSGGTGIAVDSGPAHAGLGPSDLGRSP